MGNSQSGNAPEKQGTLRSGVLADYETIYNYFEENNDDEILGMTCAKPGGVDSRGKNTPSCVNRGNFSAAGKPISSRRVKSLYEETMSSRDGRRSKTGEKGNRGNDSKSRPKSPRKLKTHKQINAELTARNVENKLREMEKKKNKRSKSAVAQPSEPKPVIHIDTQSADYWHKRRELERVLKTEDSKPSDKQRRSKKRDTPEDSVARGDESTSTANKSLSQKKNRKARSQNCGDTLPNAEVADPSQSESRERRRPPRDGSKKPQHETSKTREGRATTRDSGSKKSHRSRSAKSDASEKVVSNTKTEAELLAELKQDEAPVKITRHELVSQHVPHYALPTKKLEVRTDGRLSKLYIPKESQYTSSEWPEDLDRGYCKMVVDTFKDMYNDLITDPNWAYNQRKSYLNFVNTAEWQEMDLKLAKMSYNQILTNEPLVKMPTY